MQQFLPLATAEIELGLAGRRHESKSTYRGCGIEGWCQELMTFFKCRMLTSCRLTTETYQNKRIHVRKSKRLEASVRYTMQLSAQILSSRRCLLSSQMSAKKSKPLGMRFQIQRKAAFTAPDTLRLWMTKMKMKNGTAMVTMVTGKRQSVTGILNSVIPKMDYVICYV
jgi:hypothetical protein